MAPLPSPPDPSPRNNKPPSNTSAQARSFYTEKDIDALVAQSSDGVDVLLTTRYIIGHVGLVPSSAREFLCFFYKDRPSPRVQLAGRCASEQPDPPKRYHLAAAVPWRNGCRAACQAALPLCRRRRYLH